MKRYLALINFTDQGLRDMKQSIQRANTFGQSVEAAGGKMLSLHWSVGEADGCVTFEVPDEQTGAALLLSLAQDGNVRTRTLTLFNTEEFQEVLAKL